MYGCDGASQNPHPLDADLEISCAKFVGCGCGFVARSKLVPAIIATAI